MANIANDLTLNDTVPLQLSTSVQANTLTANNVTATNFNFTNINTDLIRANATNLTIQPSVDNPTGNITVTVSPNTWTSTETATLQFGTSSTESISATASNGLTFASNLGFTWGSLGTRFKNFFAVRVTFPPGVTSSTTFSVTLPAFGGGYRIYTSIEKSGVNTFVFQSVVDSYNGATGATVIRVLRIDTNATWTGTHFCNILLLQV